MTSGFDEWATARTPSLLRFALVVAGSDDAAATAVRTALARAWSSWETGSGTDDPDLRARSHVVGASPSRRRASASAPRRVAVPVGAPTDEVDERPVVAWLDALPLRRRAVVALTYLEDRPDDEIAEVLGVPPTWVRAQRQRALAALPASFPAEGPDREITVRAGIAALADAAGADLVDPGAGVEPPRPRPARGVWLPVLAVLALIGAVGWITHVSRSEAGVITYPRVSVPESWRVESYAGVQVRVPSTWGWGGAPIRADFFGGNGLGSCGAGTAAVGPDVGPATYVSSATPFVGRPAVLTFRCLPWGSDGVMPSTDALWFDSPMRVGLKGLGAVVAETRAVGDQHVTVFSADSRLRRQVLGSAEVVDTDANGCPVTAVQQPRRGPAGLVPTSLSVCVYSQDTGVPVLQWSGRVTAGAARGYVAAVPRSAAGSRAGCGRTPQGQWVALGLPGPGGERWDVVDPGCGRIILAGGTAVPLAPANLDPWADNAIRAYVAPRRASAAVAAYFRSPTP
ncbi:sigma-70 family RNA polymerase sigma factor [Nocardioides cynanchi]|uniref:sigma-70 family RNA polymerase sigma factor n=1 Tax=Nocardioides cynanchi TaxID=2558918 RepID=UPI001244710B|nr:sigma-70 family RNA polymerase sigma factor [Nocardioides cynanchi]